MSKIRWICHIVVAMLWTTLITNSNARLITSSKDIGCPELCNKQACTMGVLMCLMAGLNQIPINPPRGIQKVIIRNQNFLNTILTYTNLSQYGSEEIALKKLSLINCQLTSIEPEAFSHLIYLQELDLSDNKLAFIQPNTFKSLSLKTLVLDGNRNVELVENSFRGLVVNSLSMRNCYLQNISHNVIKQISGYLTTLNLAGNGLRYLSPDFDLLFRRLDNLHIERNPFNCSCQLKWLLSTLQTRSKRTKPKDEQRESQGMPLCRYPAILNGSVIETLSSASFRCQIPKIERIDIKITSTTTATISCIADPASNSPIKWRYKHLQSAMFYQYSDPTSRLNHASISVSKQTNVDFYSCLILNENGNATVDVKIVWPKDFSGPGNDADEDLKTKTMTLDNAVIINDGDSLPKNYLWLKQYTFMEMLLAICGTFIITLISFIFLYILVNYRRRNSRTKNAMKGYEVGMYSESQTYDVPQLSPYHEPNTRRLLDFKTHQEIKGNW